MSTQIPPHVPAAHTRHRRPPPSVSGTWGQRGKTGGSLARELVVRPALDSQTRTAVVPEEPSLVGPDIVGVGASVPAPDAPPSASGDTVAEETGVDDHTETERSGPGDGSVPKNRTKNKTEKYYLVKFLSVLVYFLVLLVGAYTVGGYVVVTPVGHSRLVDGTQCRSGTVKWKEGD